jgi:RTX calcium-binding nonapeptide repeat (4 copies)
MRGIHRVAVVTVSILTVVTGQAVPKQAAASAVRMSCFGKPATLTGTPGPDRLHGGPEDVVVGLGGDDSLSGGTVCGGPGHDALSAPDTWVSSRLDGGDGDDVIRGDLGPYDVLLGGAGHDYLADSPATDWEDEWDPGTDVMKGGPGNDHIVSTSGRNLIHGDAGDDRIYDYTHVRTVISGGAGDDALYPTGDNYGTNPYEPDSVTGDAGRDTAEVNRIDKVSSSERVTYVD